MRWMLALLAVGLVCGADEAPFFNGKDFTGWDFVPAKAKDAFTVKDKVIVCAGRPTGYLTTKAGYREFTLSFEYRYERPKDLKDDEAFSGNSGYLLFIGKDEVWPRCIEVQGKNRDVCSIIPIKCKATFQTDKEARKKARKPVGEWNAIRIVAKGGTIKAYLNGALISTVTKYEPKEGRIGLQSEGAEIHWRNLAIERH